MQTKLLWTSGIGVRGQVHSEERMGVQGAEAEHAMGGTGQAAEPKLRLALTVFSLHPLPSDTGHIAAISDPVVSVFCSNSLPGRPS